MYYQKPSGNHFYKQNEDGTFLHIVRYNSNSTIQKEYDGFSITTTHEKGDCLINNLTKLSNFDELIPCDSETFESNLRLVIFELGLYNYIKPGE